MQTARSVTAEIKSRGQLTIPKKIRVMSRLEEGQVVSIIPVGDSVIITPKRLGLDEARREMKKILKASGVSLRISWQGLKKNEKSYIKRLMGKKVVRVFLDSNVILSGLLSERGAPRILLDLLSLRLPFLIGSTGRYNLIEIERNLKNRMPGIGSVYKRYLPRLNLTVIPMP